MELGLSNTLLAGDPRLVDIIVGEVKSQGIFDQFRKECIADVDTKPAYQNLRTRVEGSVNTFLDKQIWKPDLNKNQLRETLRKHIHDAPYLDAGVERIVDQVVNPKVYSVFMPQVEDVVYKFLGLERPKTKERNGACGLKDLLPKDLDPVSPESDKNSLKDVSLESADGMDELEAKKYEKLSTEEKTLEEEILEMKAKDTNLENGQISLEEKLLDDTSEMCNKTGADATLNMSGKSDDKTEEDEEDSPTFEPIDIMNLNESNVSNDSHLSGISELTSHRSRSPDFCNELSRDNFDYSNQDSQLSKVSSDSRLSIVTDMGSSNHASTPMQERDDASKDKCDAKNGKDNFKAVREFESCKIKNAKNIFESKGKDAPQDIKDSKSNRSSLSSKENSRDATEGSVKDKYEHKNSKDKSKESESLKSKSKDKSYLKDSKYHKEKTSDRKKQKLHSSSKYEKYDKNKSKEKVEQTRENVEKTKDIENSKEIVNKLKDDKVKDLEEKDTSSKEAKDLKDLYKEKIRELREKKELTEKEKLNKDNKDAKVNKENKEKRDSPKDKKSYKKEHKSSSTKTSSASSDSKTVKLSENTIDGKDRKSEGKDKLKRDEKRVAKDSKSKNHISVKSESTEKLDKQEVKKFPKNEKEEKSEKSDIKKEVKPSSDKGNGKKDIKNYSQSKSSQSKNDKLDGKRDSKNDIQYKDKKRREEKKSKMKDDHSSLRKSSNDRRSTDRDGSNGSSGKSSQTSNLNSSIGNNKSGSSGLSKESSHVSNSSSETSDNVEEVHSNELKLTSDQDKANTVSMEIENRNKDEEVHAKSNETEISENNLPLKKRPLLNEDENTAVGEVKMKKPKFAKNFQEAKKLMKIRKQIEKQKLKESKKLEKKLQQKVKQTVQPVKADDTDNLASVPDEERVQIIEIPDEEYEEPYPEKQTNLTLEGRSIILLEGEPCTKDLLQTPSYSDMELCIGKSLTELTRNTQPSEEITTPSIKLESDQTTPLNTEIATCTEQSTTVNEEPKLPIEPDVMKSVIGECSGESSEIKEASGETSTSNGEGSEISKSDEESHAIKEEPVTNDTDMADTDTAVEDTKIPAAFTEDTRDVDANKDSVNEVDEVGSDEATPKCLNDESTSTSFDEDCRYFKADNEKSEKFSNFLESWELTEDTSLEEMIECLGGQVVSSLPQAMAPPLPKRKHSSSPLTDILISNSNNNNDGHKKTLDTPNEDALNSIKKRKLVTTKKQRFHANVCVPPQGLLNGENFVMPLSPESDVSATSEKIPSSNLIKEEKGRYRSSQRYSSDDLYKPRPLFSSSSRRSRRSNQA